MRAVSSAAVVCVRAGLHAIGLSFQTLPGTVAGNSGTDQIVLPDFRALSTFQVNDPSPTVVPNSQTCFRTPDLLELIK
jgi:hypothetical protein